MEIPLLQKLLVLNVSTVLIKVFLIQNIYITGKMWYILNTDNM